MTVLKIFTSTEYIPSTSYGKLLDLIHSQTEIYTLRLSTTATQENSRAAITQIPIGNDLAVSFSYIIMWRTDLH